MHVRDQDFVVILSRPSCVGKAEAAQDGRRTPSLLTLKGRAVSGPLPFRDSDWGVLRPSCATPAAPLSLRRLRMTGRQSGNARLDDHRQVAERLGGGAEV